MQYSLFLTATLTASLLLVSCSQFSSVEMATDTPTVDAVTGEQTTAQLRQSYQRYAGTPYLYGGTDSRGFDCSGFINQVYAETFARRLPRTTEGLVAGGRKVANGSLQPGDIVVFRTSAKQLHAGIYLGDGTFIHSSSSQGVTQSRLSNPYWQSRYLGARRYL